mgnify:CR=1 FL=1
MQVRAASGCSTACRLCIALGVAPRRRRPAPRLSKNGCLCACQVASPAGLHAARTTRLPADMYVPVPPFCQVSRDLLPVLDAASVKLFFVSIGTPEKGAQFAAGGWMGGRVGVGGHSGRARTGIALPHSAGAACMRACTRHSLAPTLGASASHWCRHRHAARPAARRPRKCLLRRPQRHLQEGPEGRCNELAGPCGVLGYGGPRHAQNHLMLCLCLRASCGQGCDECLRAPCCGTHLSCCSVVD